jgi:tetratricopeptide (TPR) repeat protein
MAWRRGRAEEARAFFERARATFEEVGLSHPAARISGRLADIDGAQGHFAEAVAKLEQALQALSNEEPDEDVANIAAQLGRFLSLAGRQEEGAPHLELALEIAEGLDLPEVFAQALASKSLVLMRHDRLEEARLLLEGALATAIENDLPAAAARVSNNLAVVYESRDGYVESTGIVERGVEFARRIGDRVWEGQMLAGEISTYVLLGRWDEATELARELESTGLATGSTESLLLHLIEIDCRRGQLEEARTRLEQQAAAAQAEDAQTRSAFALHEAILLRSEGRPESALETVERELSRSLAELGVKFVTVKLLLVEGLDAALDAGDRAKAEELLAIIEQLHPGVRPPLLTAHAVRIRARLTESPDEAEHGFRRAAESFDQLGVVFWRAVSQLEHGEWLVQRERAAEGEPLLKDAAAAFERLKATPWTERARHSLSVGRQPEALIETS